MSQYSRQMGNSTEKTSCERPTAINKTVESLVRTSSATVSINVSAGYQHHRIPDGLSDARLESRTPKSIECSNAFEVWTHDNQREIKLCPNEKCLI